MENGRLVLSFHGFGIHERPFGKEKASAGQ
jgi:hypothetical protein